MGRTSLLCYTGAICLRVAANRVADRAGHIAFEDNSDGFMSAVSSFLRYPSPVPPWNRGDMDRRRRVERVGGLMAAPWTRSPGGPAEDASVEILEVLKGHPPQGEVGQGLLFRTNRGDIQSILHQAPGSHQGVIWVCGARGGFGGPGPGAYARLAERFRGQAITSLRLDYRQPSVLLECVLDLLAGVSYLERQGYAPVVLVGHSFGGAVAIAAGAASSHVKGVVSLSPQTHGAGGVAQLSPRPLLVVHGKSDTRLPYACAQQIYNAAREPKKLMLYDGAEHRLEECRDELEKLLGDWIPATLAARAAWTGCGVALPHNQSSER